MPNFTFLGGTATIGAAEFSIAQSAAYSPSTPKTTLGYVQAVIDLGALAAGDQYQVRIYERTDGAAQRPLITASVSGAQAESYVTPLLLLGEGWDVTIKKLAGTDRAISWSVRVDTNDVNAATVGANAIAAAQIAPAAITAAAFGANAIDANALATSAVAELQAGLATSSAVTSVQADTTELLVRVTTARATALDRLDATISSRAPASTAVSSADYTAARGAALDRLDAVISSRAPAATALSSADYTPARAAALDRVDATISSRAAAATALSTGQWTNSRATALDRLDAAITTRAAAATALSTADFTAARATALDRLDATITSRAAAATALSNVDYSAARATALDRLDTMISSRAAAATALSSTDWTAQRAAKLEQLDAAISTRSPAATALSIADWTAPRAAALDNLDAPVTTRASSPVVAAATAALQAGIDDLRARIPAALDPDGNIRAGIASLSSGVISAIADAIFGYEIEAAPTNATTFLQRLRIWWSILASGASGLAIATAGTERFRDGADTKDRAIYTLAPNGSRTPGDFDGS